MSDIILLTSDDEKVEEKPAKKVMESNISDLTTGKDCQVTGRESWTILQEFLGACYDTEVKKRKGDSKLMKTILDKLSQRFKNADPRYTQSEAFRWTIKSTLKLVESDPGNLFVHMKQVGDELKLRCIKSKINNHKRSLGEEGNPFKKRSKISTIDVNEDEEVNQGKQVNKRHSEKLESIFNKVYRKVKKLEEKEVDWDAEEDSSFMRLERYKKRLWSIWEKWQEVNGRLEEVKRLKYRKIAFSGTDYPNVNHAIEKFVNKTRCFPDFMDIHKITSEVLSKDKEMNLSAEQIKTIATSAFTSIGNQLQKARVFNFWNSCMSYLPSTSDVCDPADQNEDLAKALKENEQSYKEKVSHVLDSFVTKQDFEKHEPVEVVIGTDDEASMPSGDDEDEEEDDEEPEDIIHISSSSSEECDSETKTSKKQKGENRGKHSSNGNIIEVKSKMKTSDSDSKHSADYIGFSASSQKKSSRCLKKVKMESFPSCSSNPMNSKASTSTEKFSGNLKNSQACEIVTLSESESE